MKTADQVRTIRTMRSEGTKRALGVYRNALRFYRDGGRAQIRYLLRVARQQGRRQEAVTAAIALGMALEAARAEAVEKAASTRTLRVTCLPDGEPEEVSEATLLEHNPDLDTRFLSSGESMVEGGGAAVAYLIEVL